MSQTLDLMIAAKNTTDAAFAKMQANLGQVQQEVAKTSAVVASSTDRYGKFADGIGKVSTTLARSAAAFGLPIGPLRALDDVADVAELGLKNLATSAVGLNAATLGVAGAGLAAGAAFGTWLRTFPAIAKAADDTAAALYRLFQSQKDIDAQANATSGLAQFSKEMAASSAAATKKQIETLKAAGMSIGQIIDTIDGKRKTSTETHIEGLKREEAALKKFNEEQKKAAELAAKVAEKTEKSISTARVTWTGFFMQIPNAIKPAEAAVIDFGDALETAIPTGTDRLRELGMVIDETTGLWTSYADVVEQELENANGSIEDATESASDLGETISAVGGLFAAMGDEAGSALEQVVSGLAKAGEMVGSLFAALASGNPAAVISSIANSWGDLKAAAQGLRDALGIEDGLLARLGLTATAEEKAAKAAQQLALDISVARAEFINAAGGLDALEAAAADAGISLDAMWNARTVAEYEAAVARVNAQIELSEQASDGLKSALDRAGLSFGDLAPQFAQRFIHEGLAELYRDLQLLAAGGVDMARVLAGPMGDELQTFVQQALTSGAALPEFMRPFIQTLIDAGDLIDAAGNKITDTSQLTFTETLEAGVARLITQIEALVNALLGIHPIEVGVSYKVNGPVPAGLPGGPGGPPALPDLPGGDLPGQAAGGWFPFRPGGYPVRVGEAGDEAVIPKEKLAGIVAQAVAMAGGSQPGGGRTVIENHIHLGGKELREWISRQKMAGYLA